MARYAPQGYTPGVWEPHNGRPAYSTDVIALDHYTAHLAAVSRPALPAVIYGAAIDASATHTFPVLVPQYTRHVRVGLQLCGRGDVMVTSDDSATVDCAIEGVTQGTGLSGSHSVSSAQWFALSAKVASPSADDQAAIRVTLQSEPAVITFSVTFTDASATETIACFGVRFEPLVTDEEDGPLPA